HVSRQLLRIYAQRAMGQDAQVATPLRLRRIGGKPPGAAGVPQVLSGPRRVTQRKRCHYAVWGIRILDSPLGPPHLVFHHSLRIRADETALEESIPRTHSECRPRILGPMFRKQHQSRGAGLFTRPETEPSRNTADEGIVVDVSDVVAEVDAGPAPAEALVGHQGIEHHLELHILRKMLPRIAPDTNRDVLERAHLTR